MVLSVALLPQKIHRDTYTRKDSHKHTSVAVESKLNLLMIISDQHRWDALGQAGNQIIQTPNLDSLAREGVRFTRRGSLHKRLQHLPGLLPLPNQYAVRPHT